MNDKNNHLIVVCEAGWIICGVIGEQSSDVLLELKDASVVRRWSNGKGIGGLAKEKYKGDYTLDEIGNVGIKQSKVLFTIPCEW